MLVHILDELLDRLGEDGSLGLGEAAMIGSESCYALVTLVLLVLAGKYVSLFYLEVRYVWKWRIHPLLQCNDMINSPIPLVIEVL